MTFDELLDRLYGFDAEIFAHDSLFVFINYRTKERKVFHNCSANTLQEWLDKTKPILMGYNCNSYDKHILRCWLSGMNPEELKQVNDHIINGGNGYDIDIGYIELPTMWDLFNEINPRKSLKELEGNLRLPITESSVPFDLPTKWTQKQYEEVLYYCTKDVEALFAVFDKLENTYKSKFIIAKYGKMNPEFALSQTNANLTAILLKAKRKEHTDNFAYKYPDCINKSKIPRIALDYFDDIIEHNDLDYNPPAPEIEYDDIIFQLGVGGGHAFKIIGTYYYERTKSKKVLVNWDFTSLYPNLVRLFGYSSRNQEDEDAYVDILNTRMTAKKGLLGDDFLIPLGLTNKDVNIGLKLPLNAYTGALRAKFNALYDNLQGFSICTTGQLIVLQLIDDLKKVPTLQMVSANTDAVMYEVDKEYKQKADEIIHNLEKLTGLEMEEDNIVRIVMQNVNNYCELVQTGDNDYAINYKGTNFECDSINKNLKLKWNKNNNQWETSFEDALKCNSLTIVGEALLKRLLLDIPVEETINNCNDIFRFQMITHLGSTYEKCVQESLVTDTTYSKEVKSLEKELDKINKKISKRNEKLFDKDEPFLCPEDEDEVYQELLQESRDIENQILKLQHCNDIELQRNNRVYAGLKPSGTIIKVKPNGRRDSLANCPPNPVVDNANELTIDDINKKWYIKIANQRVNDFLGVKRMDEYKKDELIQTATDMGLTFDKKIKKEDLIKLIEENQDKKEGECVMEDKKDYLKLLQKINQFRQLVQDHEFVLDAEMDSKLGGRSYVSIGQFYNFVQQNALKVGIDFSFEPVQILRFERDILKPSVGAPKHLAEVECVAIFTDLDTGCEKVYRTIGSGSDSIDKATSGAETMAFRNWFKFNFTPKERFNWENDDIPNEEISESKEVKVPTYIAPQVKEEIKKEVVATKQHQESDKDDEEKIAQMIMEIRKAKNDDEYGAVVMDSLQKGLLQSSEIDAAKVAIENTYFDLGLGK